MPKTNKDGAPREAKLTIAELAKKLTVVDAGIRELADQVQRFRTFTGEKSDVEEKLKFAQDRLFEAERSFMREQARAEILHAVVDRLLGVTKSPLLKNPGVDFSAPQEVRPRVCGNCGARG